VPSDPVKILDKGSVKRFDIFTFPSDGGKGLNEISGRPTSLVMVGEWVSFCSFVDEKFINDESLEFVL
jgi:hypothetical protein